MEASHSHLDNHSDTPEFVGDALEAPRENTDDYELVERGGAPGQYNDWSGLHFDNLFDRNEALSGDTIDLGTGKAYDNSTFIGVDKNGIFDEGGRQVGYTFTPDSAPLKAENDAASQWLAAHDPEYRASTHQR